MEKDTLILCPKCQGDACYKSPLNETLFSYYCFSCGYSTTDAQTVDEFDIEAYERLYQSYTKTSNISMKRVGYGTLTQSTYLKRVQCS